MGARSGRILAPIQLWNTDFPREEVFSPVNYSEYSVKPEMVNNEIHTQVEKKIFIPILIDNSTDLLYTKERKMLLQELFTKRGTHSC